MGVLEEIITQIKAYQPIEREYALTINRRLNQCKNPLFTETSQL
jgi:hypothetical protein